VKICDRNQDTFLPEGGEEKYEQSLPLPPKNKNCISLFNMSKTLSIIK
jgi:hypothetical protein